MTTTAHANLLAAIDAAGYVNDPADTYVTVIELADRFAYTLDNDGILLVSVFHKATTNGQGDFEGCPRYEGYDAAAANAALIEACK